MSDTENTNTILVFIKRQYIRDAQAYTAANLPSDEDEIYMDCELERNWIDTEPHGLVAAYKDTSIEKAKERIKNTYPDASDSIFIFLPACISKADFQKLF